jgi:hypothetical protein
MTAKNGQRQGQKQIPKGMEERKAKAKADPYGMTTKRSKCNCKRRFPSGMTNKWE